MGKMHAEGVTLVELMVTLAVVGLLLAVGVPAVRDLIATSRMSTAVNDLVSSLHLARSEALKTSDRVSVCASTNWDSLAPGCDGLDLADGWIVFVKARARLVRCCSFEHRTAHFCYEFCRRRRLQLNDVGLASLGIRGVGELQAPNRYAARESRFSFA